jgi:nitrate/TMAO reductase-like tetraheme cytochrome c subunit
VAAWILALGALVVIVPLIALRCSMRTRATLVRRLFTFLVMFALPGVWLLGMFAYADTSMRTTSFCLSCHEMRPYGESLTVNGVETLAAAHYRGGRSDRDKACYVCHTKPGLLGYVDAKLRGLHDVRVHYVGSIPETLSIRGGYDVGICLGCHGETENFREQPLHASVMAGIEASDVSCLQCHAPAHAVPARGSGSEASE